MKLLDLWIASNSYPASSSGSFPFKSCNKQSKDKLKIQILKLAVGVGTKNSELGNSVAEFFKKTVFLKNSANEMPVLGIGELGNSFAEFHTKFFF